MVGTRFDLMVDLAEKVERQLLDFSNVNNIIYDETRSLVFYYQINILLPT